MIKSPETERHCLAGAIRHPNILSEISFFVKEDDFSPGCNKVIYSAVLDSLKKSEEISVFRIAEKLNNSGITLQDLEGTVEDYLEAIKLISISEKGALESFKELKKISIRREFQALGKNLYEIMNKNGNNSIDSIIEEADKLYAGKLSIFENSANQTFEDVFEDLESIVEERGNAPVEDFGIKGPFDRTYEIYGSLLRRGNITVIAARQAEGKTQLGQYYMMHSLFKNDIPILHLDMGEMSMFELQIRATTMLTHGFVSPDMLETGKWRKNPETEAAVRKVWPLVNKIKDRYFYYDVSELTPDQIMSLIQRFYLTKVKHKKNLKKEELEFIIFYDYLKSFENNDSGDAKFRQEHQLMGYFMQKAKRTIQKKVPASIWTSLQVNRMGISGNKTLAEIDDTENVFSLSDRIIHQATHAALLRKKTMEELAIEPKMGNYKLIFNKARHLGSDRDSHINPVKMLDGSYKKNYIHLEGRNFVWKEIGDLGSLKDGIGLMVPAPNKDDHEDVELH